MALTPCPLSHAPLRGWGEGAALTPCTSPLVLVERRTLKHPARVRPLKGASAPARQPEA
jgi:hypothetical protein